MPPSPQTSSAAQAEDDAAGQLLVASILVDDLKGSGVNGSDGSSASRTGGSLTTEPAADDPYPANSKRCSDRSGSPLPPAKARRLAPPDLPGARSSSASPPGFGPPPRMNTSPAARGGLYAQPRPRPSFQPGAHELSLGKFTPLRMLQPPRVLHHHPLHAPPPQQWAYAPQMLPQMLPPSAHKQLQLQVRMQQQQIAQMQQLMQQQVQLQLERHQRQLEDLMRQLQQGGAPQPRPQEPPPAQRQPWQAQPPMAAANAQQPPYAQQLPMAVATSAYGRAPQHFQFRGR